MPPAPVVNGSNKIIWFLLTTLMSIVLTAGGAWAYSVSAANEELSKRVNTLEQSMARIDAKLDLILQFHENEYRQK